MGADVGIGLVCEGPQAYGAVGLWGRSVPWQLLAHFCSRLRASEAGRQSWGCRRAIHIFCNKEIIDELRAANGEKIKSASKKQSLSQAFSQFPDSFDRLLNF